MPGRDTAPHAERSLSDLLEDLASKTPAPGGGTAAAWATAVAAALVEMAAAFAGDRPEVATRAGKLRARALALAERELSAYEPVLEAARLSKNDVTRAERLHIALSHAADSPLEITRTAAEVVPLARELRISGNATLQGDAQTAALLGEAACRAAAQLVELNLADRPNDPRLSELRSLLAELPG
ncbi:MAG TPA: cyclodeaminase/cyclohydrolase family protein [Thermoleophilaceae bacterium]